MAVPQELTTRDISGVYYLNKTLTTNDKTDKILSYQGVGWVTRTVISAASVTLHIKHYSESGVEHIDIDTTLTGGISASPENRVLNWVDREKEDKIFGAVRGRSRRVKVDELDEEFLKRGWTEDTLEHGLIHVHTESDTPKSGHTWIASQTWGFAVVQGEKRYVRHIKFTGPAGEDIEATMVYDYVRPLDG